MQSYYLVFVGYGGGDDDFDGGVEDEWAKQANSPQELEF